MNRKFKQFLCIFLSTIIVIQILPLTAFADDVINTEATDLSNEQNLEVVGEAVDKRTEYQKTYELSDGSFYEITSASPIHEKEGSGWVEPDISEDAPETTQEAEDYVKDLSENISENANDEYGIAPASIDISDQYQPALQFNIVSATSNNLTYLNTNCEMLVKTPQIYPNSATLAQVTTSCKIKINYQKIASGYLYAYQIKDPWEIDDSQLLKVDGRYYSNILDFQQITSSGFNYWDITDTYLKWEKGIYENNGIAFATKGTCSFQIEQCSMIRQYKVIDMYDSDFTYHTIDMGRAGTVYINDFTNTVLIKRDELSIDGNILPVNLVRYIDLNGNSSVGNPYGKDTRYNYESGIRMVTSYTYAWDSFDGETVYFTPSYINPSGSYIDWKDTSGYGYEMRIFAAGINGTDYSQTILKNDDKGIAYSFNSVGKITKITKGSDSIEIVYTKNNTSSGSITTPDGLIDYIQDGNGRRYYFNYNPSKKYGPNNLQKNTLESIEVKAKSDNGVYETLMIDNQPVKLSFEYELLPDGNIALSKVIYPDSETVSYIYGYEDDESEESENVSPESDNYLTAIVDTDGRKLELQYSGEVRIYTAPDEYDSKTVDFYPSLTKYSELVKNIDNNDPSDSTDDYFIKSSLSIDRHNSYQRTFTDQNDKEELIQYNPNLKILYYRNSDGENYYADYSESSEQKLTQIVTDTNSDIEYDKLNLDFETGYLTPWYEEGGGSASVVNGSLSGKGEKMLQLVGATDNERYVAQDITVNAKKGDIYAIGGWCRGNAPIPVSTHFFGIEVYSANNFGSEDQPFFIADDEPLYRLSFDTTIDNEEQFRLGAFKLEKDTKYLEIRLVFSYQAEIVNFDDIEFYKTTNEYVTFFDDTNNSSSVSTLSEEPNENDTQIITNDKGLQTAEVISDGNKSMVTKYAYDDNYYLSSVTDTNNVTTSYSYDSNNGMLNSVTIGDKVTSFSYTPVGALKEVTRTVSGLTDNVSNISASYTYSHDRITSVTHNGIKYNFTYNSFGNVKKVDMEILSDNSSNDLIAYDYSNDSKQQLNSITYANGNILSYDYIGGKITEIYFQSSPDDSQKLMYKYDYNDTNGDLAKITDYDSNRVTEYTDNGYTVKSITVADDGSEQYSEIYSYSVDENGTVHENISGNEYSTSENDSALDEDTNETTYSSQSQFKIDGVDANITSSSVSDYFGRIKSSQLSISAPTVDSSYSHSIENNYTYEDYTASYTDDDGEQNVSATTNLIKTFESKIIDKNEDNEDVLNTYTSSYEYDSSGRITHIYYSLNNGPSALVSYYEYDESGQVITDYDIQNERVTKYLYDSGGNITSKKIYEGDDILNFDYNTNSLTLASTPTSTINYGYGYSGSDNTQNNLDGFTDLLTSYNGKNVSYDEIGNPLKYYYDTSSSETKELNLEWQGTLLKTATTADGKEKYVYSYNQEGLRTKKEVYSLSDDGSWKMLTAIDYFWQDGMISAFNLTFDLDDNGPQTMSLKMLYDEYNSPIGISINTTADIDEESIGTYSNNNGINISQTMLTSDDIWWFVKDGQGNVVEMYSAASGKTMRCSYDSYGNRTIEIDGTVIGDLWDQIIGNIQGDNAWLAPLVIMLGVIATAAELTVVFNIGQATFKGYVYDNETGLYYCQNRYYSPSWGRFISMDDPAQLTQNVEEPLNANLYVYCYNDPVNNVDPNGLSSYSLTGIGMQAEMSQNLLSFGGELGIEMVYVPTKDELYAYYYYGDGADAGYADKAIAQLNNALNEISIDSNISLKNLSNLLKLNYSISLGFFGTYTNKAFSWPYSYTGMANSQPVMIGKWNGYQTTSTGCKTYGICYSPVENSGLAFSKSSVIYQKIALDSSAIKSYLSEQQNDIKNAIS